MTTEKKEDTALIGSVCRALDIIQYMAHRQEEVSVSEISKALGMYRSMVFRMLYTLRYKGFVEQNPDNEKYRLGIKLLVLGHSLDRRSHFIKFIRPFAQKASQAFHETVNVSILDHRTDLQGYCGLIIHQESSQRGINANTRIGSLRECYCSAVGKCLLAFSDAVDLNYYMQHPLKKCAKNTITDSQALIEEIERVRHNGYAIDDEEGDDDLFCIGVPILADGTAIGAISISGPIQRMKNEDLPRKIQFMTDLRREISDKLSMK